MNFFDEVFNEMVSSGFSKARAINFRTGYTQDMNPAIWEAMHGEKGEKIGYRATCRAVGVNEDDISIEVENDGLRVKGNTKCSDDKRTNVDEYSFDYFLPIVSDVLANITSIQYKAKNGLLYVYVNISNITKKQIKVAKL